MHNASYEAYVEWAVACLEDGLDSKNLGMLAALEKPYYSFEIETHFRRALAEFGFTWPERETFLLEYAKEVAQQIIAREIEPLAGVRTIYGVWVELDYISALQDWCYLDDGLCPETFRYFIDPRTDEIVSQDDWNEAVIYSARKLLGLPIEPKIIKEGRSKSLAKKIWRKIF